MKKHQRYFPVVRNGKLMPYFITVTNCGQQGDPDLKLVVEGNEHVLRARFADASFFLKKDLSHSLEEHLERLKTTTFQVKLGSMYDKAQRVSRMVEVLSGKFLLSKEETSAAQRAAQLCKADLATQMVVEMTSLQGVMGRYYALKAGEGEAVAQTIYEHHLPRFSGDSLPQSSPGRVVGIADRLDTLAGLFAAGLAPTGAKDPFALRRTAVGLVQLLLVVELPVDLHTILKEVVAPRLPIPMSEEVQHECLQFIVERLRNLLLDQGYRYDVVDAVIVIQGHNPASAVQAVKELTNWVNRPDWNTILPAYARCARITRDMPERYPVSPNSFFEPAEKKLWASLLIAEAIPRKLDSVEELLRVFTPMIPAIDRFFVKVLVMSEDKNLRKNRLALLQRIVALGDGIVDLSRLEGF